MGSRRKLAPDDLVLSRLAAAARRLAFDDATPRDAASELRSVAAGRTDLLTRAAGTMAGFWFQDPINDSGMALIAAGFLVPGGEADSAELRRWVEVGHANAVAAHRPWRPWETARTVTDESS